MYKVPFRSIYCDTISNWVSEIFWCFVVIKIYPRACNLNPIYKNLDGSHDCPYCSSKMVGYSIPENMVAK